MQKFTCPECKSTVECEEKMLDTCLICAEKDMFAKDNEVVDFGIPGIVGVSKDEEPS